jgi:Fe2+ transport system protein FeoA
MSETSDGQELVSLTALRPGQSGVVRVIEGGRGMLARLASMGMMLGMTIRMVRGDGPVIVEVQDNRLVLGRGLVGHVKVQVEAQAGGVTT